MRHLLGSAAVTLALVLVAGCSGSAGEGSSSSAEGGGAGAVADEGGAASDGDAERQVITNASASLVVDDPADAAQEVSERVESAGGRVDERTEYAATGDGEEEEGSSADLVVRVPSDALTDVLADLEDLGEVASVSVSRSDVTGQTVDLDARISALQTSAARLQALLDEAPTTEALLAAEGALSARQEQLESLQSQRGFLADQVALSTLRLHLQQPGVAPPGGPDGFVDGLSTGWNALVSAAGAAVIALGVLLPWLVVGAVLAATVLVTLRRARRRSALPAPAPAAAPEA